MLTFIDLMGKKKNDEDPEEEESSGREKKKLEVSVGWQDILILVVIACAIFGAYKYYQYTKRESEETFARCALLYDSADYASALACYDSTMELGYVSVEMDSLRGLRIGEISDMLSAQMFVLEDVRKALGAGDTAVAADAMKSFSGPLLLEGADAAEWESLRSLFAERLNSAEPDSSALPADSVNSR